MTTLSLDSALQTQSACLTDGLEDWFYSTKLRRRGPQVWPLTLFALSQDQSIMAHRAQFLVDILESSSEELPGQALVLESLLRHCCSTLDFHWTAPHVRLLGLVSHTGSAETLCAITEAALNSYEILMRERDRCLARGAEKKM